MKALALAPVLALAAFTFAVPSSAEAGHRHSRNCKHSGYYSRDFRPFVRHHRCDRSCRARCEYRYSRRHAHRHHGPSGYRYYDRVPYHGDGYYAYVPPPPPPVVRHRRRHHRPRVGIYIGF